MRPAPTVLRVRLHGSLLHQLPRAGHAPATIQSHRPAVRGLNTASAAIPKLSPAFFLPNSLLVRVHGRVGAAERRASSSASASSLPTGTSDSTTTTTTRAPVAHQLLDNENLLHRRRQAAKRNAASPNTPDPALPPDASSLLTTVAARQPADSLRRQLSAFLSLSKPRLTVLVVLTAMASYALFPVPAFLSPALAEVPSLSPLTLLFLTTGTALCSASANSLNMLYEPKTDSLMTRTRNRPLVRGLVSTRAAVLFAIATAATGIGALYFGVNGTVASLGAANIAIYAAMYTPLKAITAANTWVGAVVGGIPPLMGWAAAAGESATGDGSWRELLFASDGSSIGGWLLATLLFAWEFPHFMALSWSIREEYKAAGLRMLCWTNPQRNARVALRYSLAFVPLCVALCASGITEWSFAVTSLPVNGWLAWQAVRFWRDQGFKGSARGLFWASVLHLPAVMVLALVQKKGMWQRVRRSLFPGDDDWVDEDEGELDEMGSEPVVYKPSRKPV